MSDYTVLLVEDDPDRVMLTRRALAESDSAPSVEVAKNGKEALEWLSDANPLPDLVLLDLDLPEIDGFGVLEQVEEEKRLQIPFVVLTSSNDNEDMLQSYALGANGYVIKPVDFDEFRENIQLTARFWLEVNLAPTDVKGI